MKLLFRDIIVAAVAAFALPILAYAQPVLLPTSSLVGDDPDGTSSVFGDAYGVSADTWGRWLVVGTPRETALRDGADVQDGAVYIYRRSGGVHTFWQKLTMPGSSDLALPIGDRFGGGVAVANGWLFVAAPNDQDFPGLVDPRRGILNPGDPPFVFAGQVHVYKLVGGSSWEYVQTLTSPEPGSSGSFGARSQASHIALNSKANVAVIGELNNFTGGIGQLHTYRRKAGNWQYVETLDPPAGIDSFGDDLDFADDRFLVAGGSDFADDELSQQGFVFVYRSKGKGKFFAEPQQTLSGPVVAFGDCPVANSGGFGRSGLDASRDVVVIADPCASGAAGPFAGTLSVYRVGSGPSPLTLRQVIEGDQSDLWLGGNFFASRNAVAVSKDGKRILAGTALSPVGTLDASAAGADVRVYRRRGGVWMLESTLTTPTPASAQFRSFGDTVFFIGRKTALVREGNIFDPVVTGYKGQGLIYDLVP